jgi:hypothetical protein
MDLVVGVLQVENIVQAIADTEVPFDALFLNGRG